MGKFKSYLIGILFLFQITASAGVLIEPYLGFSLLGSGDTTYGTTQYDHDYGGLSFGGRLGYSYLGFMGGLDYSMSNHDLESKQGTFASKDGIERKQLGIFVGYQLPVLLRVWGTYFLSASFDGADSAKSSNQLFDSKDVVEDGSGFALGAGLTTLPFLSINLEYRSFSYDTNKYDGTNITNYNGTSLSEFLFSVSVPIDI